MRVVLVGLALSVFLGLAIRAQISEARIQGYLNKTIERLQADFFVDYDVARVNLSSWGLPWPALVVQNIRFSPKNTLCQNSQLFVDELEVPISLTTILGISKTIPKIRAHSVELRLSGIENCTGPSAGMAPALSSSPAAAPRLASPGPDGTAGGVLNGTAKSGAADVKDVFTRQTRAELKEIYIERLKLISGEKPDQPILLKQLSLEFAYTERRLTDVNLYSKINALKDPRSDLYFLNANMEAQFRSADQGKVETILNLKGKLLDGDTQLFLHAFSGSGKISYEWAVDRVSLKTLLPFLTAADTTRAFSLEKIPTAASFTNTGEIFLTSPLRVDSRFKNIVVNIDNGVLKVADLELQHQNSRLRLRPFELEMNALSLSVLKNFEQFRNRLDSFENLGDLSGRLRYRDEDSYRFSGTIRNVQTVFSNRGRRDLQTIDSAALTVSRTGPELKVQAETFVIGGRAVPGGRFEAVHDLTASQTTAQLRLAGNLFNPKIWEQFTFVEQSPRVDILWNYRNDGDESHDLKLSVDQLQLPGIELSSLSVNLAQTLSAVPGKGRVYLSLRPARVIASQSFLQQPVVAQILNPAHGFRLKALTSARTHLAFTGPDWKNIVFTLDSRFLSDLNLRSDTHLLLKGTAQYEKGLNGYLTMQSRNQSSKFNLKSEPEGEIYVTPVP